jgi:hypothetical protein
MNSISLIILSLLMCIKVLGQEDPCTFVRTVSNRKDSTGLIKPELQKRYINLALQGSVLKLNKTDESRTPICKISASSIFQARFESNSIKWNKSVEIFDETGFNGITDSLFQIDKDLTKVKVSISPKSAKIIRLEVNSSIQSQKLSGYSQLPDSMGKNNRTQSSGFLSPGSLLLNGGIAYSSESLGKLELGLASGRIVWVLDKQLYTNQHLTEIAGVEEGKGYNIDGGFNLQSRLEKSLGTHWRWENASNWFYPINPKGNMEVQFRNTIFWKPFSSIQACFRTTYTYDDNRWPPGLWSGEFSLGYVFERKP